MEEMKELFYRDPYAKEFDAEVVRCVEKDGKYLLQLSDTAFYPEGGGQPCDHGTINRIEVSDVQRDRNGVIWHTVSEPVAEGGTVHGIIDWKRRFDFMQQHSGEHLFSGFVHQKFGYDNVGFHMNEKLVMIDFDGPMTLEEAEEIEQRVNEAVWADLPSLITYPSREELDSLSYRSKKELTGTVRIVTYPGVDVCACCGTHVAHTGEIGPVLMTGFENYKGGVRISLLAGNRAIAYMRQLRHNAAIISRLLSVPPLETAEAAEKLQVENTVLHNKIRELYRLQLDEKYSRVEENAPLVLDFEEEGDPVELRRFCNRAVEEKHVGVCGAFLKEADGWRYILISQSVDLRAKAKQLNSALNGRGGGSVDMIQGRFMSQKTEIEDTLKALFTSFK